MGSPLEAAVWGLLHTHWEEEAPLEAFPGAFLEACLGACPEAEDRVCPVEGSLAVVGRHKHLGEEVLAQGGKDVHLEVEARFDKHLGEVVGC